MNKKGNIQVVALVVLTLFLTTSSLLLFQLNAGKASAEITESSVLESLYVKENIAKYYIFVVGNDLISKDKMNKDDFMNSFAKLKLNEEYLISLQKLIAEGKFKIDKESFELEDKSFVISYEDKNFKIDYTTTLKVKFLD